MGNIKRRNFTFALTVEYTPNIDDIIEIVRKFLTFAFILHNRDIEKVYDKTFMTSCIFHICSLFDILLFYIKI